jgi:hypothetical protein
MLQSVAASRQARTSSRLEIRVECVMCGTEPSSQARPPARATAGAATPRFGGAQSPNQVIVRL